MSIFEYDEELHKRTLIEEGMERGREEGKLEGKLEGREEGKLEGKAEALLELLEESGDVPIKIKEKILAEKDMETLKRWIKLAANTESIQQFLTAM
ncbi:MAG: hypothetical protein NC412_15395, partial [Roseburia sp.]|nr:hypothetical protein [Roseburia sp.]MCM1280145.1 hypothetical protein [Robinsoniella sp.]